MSDDHGVVTVPPKRVVEVVLRMVELPWPEGDELLEWEVRGLEGYTTWMTHVLPLASRGGSAAASLATAVADLADRRWGPRRRFDASLYTDDATTPPPEYDRRSAPADLVRSLGAVDAAWWRHDGHAVLLVDSTATAPDDDKLAVLVMPAQWMGPAGEEEEALGHALVQEFLSGDERRVISALWKVVATRDAAVLAPVAKALPAIERATADLELGGALLSNANNLDHALDRVRAFKAGTCLCTTYPDHPRYDPEKEEERGHARVVETLPNDRQWRPDRICVCTDCGRTYRVEEGEYHYTWWKWTQIKRR